MYRPKIYLFIPEICPMEPFLKIPTLIKPIVFESFGKNGGFGIGWLGWLLVLRKPDSRLTVPTIDGKPFKITDKIWTLKF
jgi:hypothetical protein